MVRLYHVQIVSCLLMFRLQVSCSDVLFLPDLHAYPIFSPGFLPWQIKTIVRSWSVFYCTIRDIKIT